MRGAITVYKIVYYESSRFFFVSFVFLKYFLVAGWIVNGIFWAYSILCIAKSSESAYRIKTELHLEFALIESSIIRENAKMNYDL